jgi:catechol 2,3-dioxygenase-like lactoylglutathione lyase family enzyme
MPTASPPTARFKCTNPRLPVADLKRTVDFYTRILGFHVGLLWPEEKPTFCLLDRDDVCMAFDAVKEPIGSPRAGVYVEVEDAQSVHDAIKNHVKIEWGPEVYHYGRREFAILDPDGTMLIFTEPTSDPPTCRDE